MARRRGRTRRTHASAARRKIPKARVSRGTPGPGYEALINQYLVTFGYQPTAQGLFYFNKCANAIGAHFGLWTTYKDYWSAEQVVNWMGKIYDILQANAPDNLTPKMFFKFLCMDVPALSPSKEQVPNPKQPSQPRPIPFYIRGRRRRRRWMRG